MSTRGKKTIRYHFCEPDVKLDQQQQQEGVKVQSKSTNATENGWNIYSFICLKHLVFEGQRHEHQMAACAAHTTN